MTALEKLAGKIRAGRELGLLPVEFDELAQAALAEAGNAWLDEVSFRARTGASDKWCRQHFGEYVVSGLARPDPERPKRRQWHIHARLPRTGGVDADAIRQQIVQSYEVKRVS